MSYNQSLLLLFLLLAALADLKTDHIPNGFIAIGIATGLTGSYLYGPGLFHSVVSMFLAFLLLYPLFQIGAMGAGDSKTLIMAGSFLKVQEFLIILAAAFVIGAVFSLFKLAAERNGRQRLFYLGTYVVETAKNRRFKVYGEELVQDQELYRSNKIHFTVPILFGAALRIGGLI